MISTLKAEFRKLLTIRSTYIITGLVIALVIFVAFYVEGWRVAGGPIVHSPTLLSSDVLGGLSVTVFGAIVAILAMTHEYRYSTIMYTLTSSKSRSRVLLSKVIVISVYALVLATIVAILSPLMSDLGIHAAGGTLVHQTLNVWDLAWRSLFYGWGYSMAGLLIAVIARNQVASIATLFLVPDLAESLLSLLLKNSTIYLPFTSLNEVIGASSHSQLVTTSLTPSKAALVFAGYLIVAWVIGWVLFLRRDAI
ncbi:MAG: ABC transporter permease [Candidatus Saccharimonadales bacterium]